MNYFQVLFWPGGGVIGLLLWLISIATVAIMVEHCRAVRRRNILPDGLGGRLARLFETGQYRRALDLTARDASFLAHVTHAALSDAPHGYPAMERAMEEAAEQRTTHLLRHIEWLNLIGNITPMLGLLGTVWGMLNAFLKIRSIAEAGAQVDAGKLAGAIGIALVTTLLGLAIAIPALAIYSMLRNRIDALTSEAMVVSQQLLASFREPTVVDAEIPVAQES